MKIQQLATMFTSTSDAGAVILTFFAVSVVTGLPSCTCGFTLSVSSTTDLSSSSSIKTFATSSCHKNQSKDNGLATFANMNNQRVI